MTSPLQTRAREALAARGVRNPDPNQVVLEMKQWLAVDSGRRYSLEIPDTAANFLCGAAIAGAAWVYGRLRNWRKHGWGR